MVKDDSGRLLAKMARFVRNPLKDWAELDAPGAAPAEAGYSREELKEMIERRQRNDFVRRREFDMLRKLRRREVAGAGEGAVALSSFSTSGHSQGRALTLKKIDEIEEQMSQQWWKSRSAPGEGQAPPPAAPSAESESRLLSIDASGLVCASGLEEASIRFAVGDDAGAESILLQLLVPGSAQAQDNDIWRALLDLYRATGELEKFTAASTRYAQQLQRPAPPWVSLRALARARACAAVCADAPAAGRIHWSSPPRLTRESLGDLTRSLSAAGPVWAMDWGALEDIAPDAAAPLRALFVHWGDSPVQLRFAGADRLRAVLERATPVGRREVDGVGWLLRMAVLRAMHESDAFELVALNYCITYEIAPPPWADPCGGYGAMDAAGGAPASPSAPAPIASIASPRGATGAGALPASARPALVGELTGPVGAVLQRLEADLARAGGARVCCGALVRVDLDAARGLLEWVGAQDLRGRRIEFADAHRLIGAFFHVVGITDHARLTLRAG